MTDHWGELSVGSKTILKVIIKNKDTAIAHTPLARDMDFLPNLVNRAKKFRGSIKCGYYLSNYYLSASEEQSSRDVIQIRSNIPLLLLVKQIYAVKPGVFSSTYAIICPFLLVVFKC
jgi:hypothetical protein